MNWDAVLDALAEILFWGSAIATGLVLGWAWTSYENRRNRR